MCARACVCARPRACVFSISWAHLGESIHAVIKCFESMSWIIFSNCARAIKLPPTNLTPKMRESTSKGATGKDSKYFPPATSALSAPKLFVRRFRNVKRQTLLGIWASLVYALPICVHAAAWMCSRYCAVDPSITLLLNAISGQWRQMSLLMLAFVVAQNLIKWMYWREEGQFGKYCSGRYCR